MRFSMLFCVFLLFIHVLHAFNCNIDWPKLQILVYIDVNDPSALTNYENILLASLYHFWTSKYFDIIMVVENDTLSEEIIEITKRNTDRWSLHIVKNYMPDYIYYKADSLVRNGTEFVAIVDVSTAISAHVFVQDLFDDTSGTLLPRVNAFLGAGGKNVNKKRDFSRKISGVPEIVRGDTYAPVILKVSNIAFIREYIVRNVGLETLSDLAKYLERHEGLYSTSSVMLNVLYHYNHDEYKWHLIHERVDKMDEIIEIPVYMDDIESYYPRIAVHVERASNLKDMFHVGHCYSLPMNAPAFDKLGICYPIAVTTPNKYEWRFASVNIMKGRDELVEDAHLNRRQLVEQCFRLIFNV